MAGKIHFVNLPGSIHQVGQMALVLTELQLKARGMQISDYSVMTAAGVPNIVPPDGNSEQDMWKSEQEDKAILEADLLLLKAGILKDHPELAAAAGAGGPPGGKPSGTGPKGGRPPTAGAPPHLEQHSGRTVVSESK